MSVICYVTYEDSPVDYFYEHGMKGTRATIFDIETNEPVIIFDYHATDEIMYWFYFEIAEHLRETDGWIKYMMPWAREDSEFAIATHVRPKAVWINVQPELIARFNDFFNIRATLLETGAAEVPDRTYVSGREMAVYEQDGTRRA